MRDIDLKKYVGRDYNKYNCFDLVKEFYKDFFGVEIKDYYDGATPSAEEVQNLIVSNRGDFDKVDDIKFGDIIVIELFGIECHIGVAVSEYAFLHSIKSTGSSFEKISKYKNRITGFYRHREITA